MDEVKPRAFVVLPFDRKEVALATATVRGDQLEIHVGADVPGGRLAVCFDEER